ncbi:hypothetical protein QTP70_019105 [Hemibagrus guttatus]|uniref:B30.2/SPRY domain-containing protein n=1 Tax=Hemibagrus guttatus TaxID=175788 RepID=A0AAE0RGS0_9TELE|nr:hypothetical protein QTP70_019105 [Hemibagrus guttatus]KAK3573461.1 hypothetical protein QTP86_024676 [Hemibagrus guttatus]
MKAIHLDANTAHPNLEVSEDQLEVRWSKQNRKESKDTEHISTEYSILAKESFLSGSHYWETGVWEKPYWLIELVNLVKMRISHTLLNAVKFRTVFDFGEREVAHWFPGHMAKGLKQMRASLRKVDCIIEIHDARISLSRSILKQLERDGVKNVLFTDCLKQRDMSIKKIIPLVTDLIENAPRFHREENRSYCVMVIGVPNVGKSSLINALRRTNLKKGKASRVGGEPGITKAVLTKIQVCERPVIHLLDTPGVLAPKIENVETGMKLALCGTILDHLVGEDIIADYLLFSLNRLERFGNPGMNSYVERYDLEAPSDDVQHVLKCIAVKLGKTQRVKAITGVGDITIKMPNYTAAAYDFIRAFRKGELGKVMLD